MSWSGVTEAATTWSGETGDGAKTWTGLTSHTTLRNSSRFIRLDGSSDGTGGVDFLYRIVADNADPHRFFIESSTKAPISLRSTTNSPS